MSRSLRRGALAALVLAIAPLSACAAGNDTATSLVKPNTAATSLGDTLKLNNILVVTQPQSAGAESEAGPASISVNISNTGTTAAVLKSVSLADAGTATITGPQGGSAADITIPAGSSVLLGGPGQPSVQVPSADVQLGGYSQVTFAFDSAGTVSAPAAVVSGNGVYASFAPTMAPPPPAADTTAGLPLDPATATDAPADGSVPSNSPSPTDGGDASSTSTTGVNG